MRKTTLLLTFILISICAMPAFCEIGIGLDELISGKKQIESTQKKAVKKVEQKPKIIKKEITISKNGKVQQGDTVFIEVKSPSALKDPYFTFKGKKIKLFKKDEGVYKGLIGIDAWHKQGDFMLAFKDATGALGDQKVINISARRYPNQFITLSKAKSSLSATKEELRQIQIAKTAFSPKALFGKPPFNSPTEGCIGSVYGLNRYYNNVIGGYHKGVDIAAPQGQVVKALTDGIVTVSGMYRLHGGTVGINHGQGITTIYLHLHKLYVKPGQAVKAGDPIAEVGSTGISTGPHLHWGLYINGVPIDPYVYWTKPCKKCGS